MRESISDDEYPMSILIAVVLPAPFGPSIPKHSPRLMPIVNPRTACVRMRVHKSQKSIRALDVCAYACAYTDTDTTIRRLTQTHTHTPACFAGGPGYVLQRSSTCTASLSARDRESRSRARTRVSSSSTSGACSRVQMCVRTCVHAYMHLCSVCK